jgi:methyl-accepting chemotaxis protein
VCGVGTNVAGIARLLDFMTNLVKNHRIGKSGDVYLVSGNGTFMLHSTKSKIEQRIELSLINSNVLYGHLEAKIAKEQLYAPVNNIINKNIIVGVVIALIGFAFVRILTGQILNPLKGLLKL